MLDCPIWMVNMHLISECICTVTAAGHPDWGLELNSNIVNNCGRKYEIQTIGEFRA